MSDRDCQANHLQLTTGHYSLTTDSLLLYYITDRTQLPGIESERFDRLLKKIAEAADAGVDYVQLREKDLPARQLESLSREAAQLIHQSGSKTRIMINSRTDVAIAAQADGVHLTSNDISPVDVRNIWRAAHGQDEPVIVIGVSCHTEAEVVEAKRAAADFVVFGPVFEKRASELSPVGIDQLQKVCQHKIPVIALGSVTPENARSSIEAGASGVAGIRLFQEGDVSTMVVKLRNLT
ncbi:MAG: thiamine-phosphate diphosphorylase [Acidobacteriaceae bacterium]|nr:thiamine-phosphate diphosphorylase [Acidobacteriaceae bacterium]